jgi:hypothetical protein
MEDKGTVPTCVTLIVCDSVEADPESDGVLTLRRALVTERASRYPVEFWRLSLYCEVRGGEGDHRLRLTLRDLTPSPPLIDESFAYAAPDDPFKLAHFEAIGGPVRIVRPGLCLAELRVGLLTLATRPVTFETDARAAS